MAVINSAWLRQILARKPVPDLSAIFDASWYLEAYPDIVGTDPLMHFNSVGWAEGRKPHPLFDTEWYLRQYPDVEEMGINPLLHYLGTGWREGRQPSPLFDARWYLEVNPDVMSAGVEPLRHFIEIGAYEGRAPHILFDPNWYKEQVAQSLGSVGNPLLHYLAIGWRLRVSPHPLFDAEWYARQQKLAPQEEPLSHYIETGFLNCPHPLFDAEWYLHAYPDVAESGGNPLVHFLTSGWNEGRNPGPYFDTLWYIKQNPDLNESGENPLIHYALKGGFQGRSPSERFDTVYYLDRYEDVRRSGLNPLTHYIVSGISEGRYPKSPETKALGAYEYCSEYVSSHTGPAVLLEEGGPDPICKFTGELAVHLHLFHADMGGMFARALYSIPCAFDLYISVRNSADIADVERVFRSVGNVRNLVVEAHQNRGRDIGPMLAGFGSRLKKYDLFMHLHSKKSDHTPGKRDWAVHLLHHLLHSRAHFTRILNLFEERAAIGLVFPVYHQSVSKQIKWGANLETAQNLMEQLGEQISESDLEAFPAGSFFVVRTDAIRPLLDRGLDFSDFDSEAAQQDGTLAHAIERLWPIVCSRNNYNSIQVRAQKPHSLRTSYIDGDRYQSPILDEALLSGELAPLEYKRKSGAELKVAFFSCATNGYDVPLPFESLVDGADHIFFCDQSPNEAWSWKVRSLQIDGPDPIRIARRHKSQPHRILPGFDIAVWIDGNVVPVGNVSELLDRFVDSGADFGVIPHPYRSSIYEEAELLIRYRRDDPDLIRRQIDRYRAEGLPESSGLTETNFLVMNLRSQKVLDALDLWCDEITKGSCRDQLSFDYAVWKSGARKVDLISNGLSVRANSRFSYFPHGGKGHPLLTDSFEPDVGAATDIAEHGEVIAATPMEKRSVMAPDLVPKRQATHIQFGISVDVIICVHNSPDDVARCLRSAALARDSRTRLIIVDDGSQEPTRRVIQRHLAQHPEDILIRHDEAKGYTKAANAGMRASDRDYMILLNSDTIVPLNWVNAIVSAGESDPKVGILGPLSNAASWQSVPETLKPDGDFAINALSDWLSVSDMAEICSSFDTAEVHRAPVTNGFCFAVKRAVTDLVGYLDEESFPFGYGEENDLCFRALDAGFFCGFTTRTYVYHAKSKSFNHERRLKLSKVGFEKLVEKHSLDRLKDAVNFMRDHTELAKVRAHVSSTLASLSQKAKPICFYLPQFHPFEINDKAWGDGFTEWRNVVKGRPRHEGHYQPRLPGKLGFYDLRLPETLRAQAELAADSGVYGFSVYYYRFGEERVMGEPTDVVMRHGDIPFRFYYCWANEDWTRAWDGKTSEVILKQDYSNATLERVVGDIVQACADPRYIRVDDRPVFGIYQLNKLPDAAAVISRIRTRVRDELGTEILIATTYNDEFKPEWSDLVDMIVQFPPHRMPRASARHLVPVSDVPGADPEKKDFFERYDDVVGHALDGISLVPKLHPGVCPDWDNSVRRAKNANILIGSTPAKFSAWVAAASRTTVQKYQSGEIVAPMLFVNAWNEWAEGAMLEPCEEKADEYLAALKNGLGKTGATPTIRPAQDESGNRSTTTELI